MSKENRLLLTAHMDDECVFFAPLLASGQITHCLSATQTDLSRRTHWHKFQSNFPNVKFDTLFLNDDYNNHLSQELPNILNEYCPANNIKKIYTHSLFGEVNGHWHHTDCACAAGLVAKTLGIDAYGLYWGGYLPEDKSEIFSLSFEQYQKIISWFREAYITEWNDLYENYSIKSSIRFGPLNIQQCIAGFINNYQECRYRYGSDVFSIMPEIWSFTSDYEQFKRDHIHSLVALADVFDQPSVVIEFGSNDGCFAETFKTYENVKQIVCVEISEVYDEVLKSKGFEHVHKYNQLKIDRKLQVVLNLSQVIYYLSKAELSNIINFINPDIIILSQNEEDINSRQSCFNSYRTIIHKKQPNFVGITSGNNDVVKELHSFIDVEEHYIMKKIRA